MIQEVSPSSRQSRQKVRGHPLFHVIGRRSERRLCNTPTAQGGSRGPPVIGLIFVVRQLGTPGIYPRSMDTRKRNGDPTRPPWVSQLYHIPVLPQGIAHPVSLPVGLYPSIRQQTSDGRQVEG